MAHNGLANSAQCYDRLMGLRLQEGRRRIYGRRITACNDLCDSFGSEFSSTRRLSLRILPFCNLDSSSLRSAGWVSRFSTAATANCSWYDAVINFRGRKRAMSVSVVVGRSTQQGNKIAIAENPRHCLSGGGTG